MVNIDDADTRQRAASADVTTIDGFGAGSRGPTAFPVPHPNSVMTRELVIPMVSVKRDQLEEKYMRGTEQHIGEIAAHGGPTL